MKWKTCILLLVLLVLCIGCEPTVREKLVEPPATEPGLSAEEEAALMNELLQTLGAIRQELQDRREQPAPLVVQQPIPAAQQSAVVPAAVQLVETPPSTTSPPGWNPLGVPSKTPQKYLNLTPEQQAHRQRMVQVTGGWDPYVLYSKEVLDWYADPFDPYSSKYEGIGLNSKYAGTYDWANEPPPALDSPYWYTREFDYENCWSPTIPGINEVQTGNFAEYEREDSTAGYDETKDPFFTAGGIPTAHDPARPAPGPIPAKPVQTVKPTPKPISGFLPRQPVPGHLPST